MIVRGEMGREGGRGREREGRREGERKRGREKGWDEEDTINHSSALCYSSCLPESGRNSQILCFKVVLVSFLSLPLAWL